MNEQLRHDARAGDPSSAWPQGAVSLPDSLSERERQLVLLLARGLPVKQIAAHVGTRVQTVSNQLTSLYRKIGAQGRFDALVVLGFVSHPPPAPAGPGPEPKSTRARRSGRTSAHGHSSGVL